MELKYRLRTWLFAWCQSRSGQCLESSATGSLNRERNRQNDEKRG
ncbi:hypothetical protein IQ22_00424 [Pseudomonas duriflava]|uniref:Uncharacterized protein n=1 Tax=Pseudomonas duriflava TaxID=459528 RepID=A0A562QPV8_9PSED|nr:hypothetical protein [Pseudomonas duriflava]TWI58713.1 hypothetical protein IQ22_00424 [Pseudomonas duriflava]